MPKKNEELSRHCRISLKELKLVINRVSSRKSVQRECVFHKHEWIIFTMKLEQLTRTLFNIVHLLQLYKDIDDHSNLLDFLLCVYDLKYKFRISLTAYWNEWMEVILRIKQSNIPSPFLFFTFGDVNFCMLWW